MTLDDVRGHVEVRRLLARAVERASLPPSLVLTGPDGVGKRQVGLGLAMLLNCETLRDDGALACGVCRACERIGRGVHTDVILLEPGESGAIKVDEVRRVVDQASFRPFEGRRRVVIIDEADRLVPEAQNALLKTLEEPPAASVFLLVTARSQLLLPTVRSRCPQLRFGSLTVAEVVDVLVTRHDFEPAAARAAAAAADGSVAGALEAGSGDYLQARDSAAALLRALASGPSAKRRLESGKEWAGSRRSARSSAATERNTLTRRLRALGTLLRDLHVIGADADRLSLANLDLEAKLTELARSYNLARASRGFESVDRAVVAVGRNASPKVVVDWLALRL